MIEIGDPADQAIPLYVNAAVISVGGSPFTIHVRAGGRWIPIRGVAYRPAEAGMLDVVRVGTYRGDPADLIGPQVDGVIPWKGMLQRAGGEAPINPTGDTMTIDEKLDTLIAQFSTLNAKLEAIIGATNVPVQPVKLLPNEIPELTLAQIDPETADGHTIQADGSVWSYQFPDLPPGQRGAGPFRSVYGYFSRAKDPDTYDKVCAIVGRDRVDEALAANGPYARYVGDMASLLRSGAANFVSLGGILNNPIRPR